MKAIRYPITSALLSEARLYAQESYGYTMNYKGWDDQYKKMARMTYGKFAQLWVADFCRVNDIDYVKDTSSPYVAHNLDLTICGHSIDVKASINRTFIGQVSPGVINKPCDYFCFVVTDDKCSFVEPIGFIDCDMYRSVSVKVNEGDLIPGTNTRQRFETSFFLPRPAPVTPFVQFLVRMRDASKASKVLIGYSA